MDALCEIFINTPNQENPMFGKIFNLGWEIAGGSISKKQKKL